MKFPIIGPGGAVIFFEILLSALLEWTAENTDAMDAKLQIGVIFLHLFEFEACSQRANMFWHTSSNCSYYRNSEM